jgi:tRNA-dihydrouridine synthase
LAQGAVAAGAVAVIVHARTAVQLYLGKADWSVIARWAEVLPVPVIGSGDVFTAQDCLDLFAETGVDAVAVARGAIGNPWIFPQVRALSEGRMLSPPSLHQQREVIAEHYRLSEELYGPSRCCRVMRKFGIKYARLHPQFQAVRDAFVAVTEPTHWRDVLDQWYAEDLPGVAPTRLDEGYYGGLSEDEPCE